MFTRQRPDDRQLQAILESADASPFSPGDVGFSREKTWHVDVHRVRVGDGSASLLAAKEALRHWRMFEMKWLHIFPSEPIIRTGEPVAVVVSHFGFRSVNVSRILYVIDDPDQYGFVYATTPQHAESGEERFRVLRDPRDDSVWYEITAFSRPNHLAARIGLAFTRALQERFANDSMAAMKRAVAG